MLNKVVYFSAVEAVFFCPFMKNEVSGQNLTFVDIKTSFCGIDQKHLRYQGDDWR